MGLKAVLALAGVVLSITAEAQVATSTTAIGSPSENRRFRVKADYDLELGMASVQENKDTFDGNYLYFSPNFEVYLLPELKLKISPWARFISARIQDRFKDDDSDGFIYLYDAYLGYEPTPWIEVRGGVLSQSVLRTSMMVSNYQSFPGAQVRLKSAKNKDVEGQVVFQYTIPTSSSGTADRNTKEELPTFKTGHAEVKSEALDGWEFKAYGGLFEWTNLPSKVAIKSATMGNSQVDGALVTRYTDGYRGFFGGADACFCQGPLGFGLEFKRVHNSEAQSYAADAQSIGGGPRFKFNNMELDIRYRSYFIESDATVAYYNKSRFGHTNRVGDNIDVKLHFLKHNFALFFETYNARTLSADSNQFPLRTYFFGVETDNVSFF